MTNNSWFINNQQELAGFIYYFAPSYDPRPVFFLESMGFTLFSFFSLSLYLVVFRSLSNHQQKWKKKKVLHFMFVVFLHSYSLCLRVCVCVCVFNERIILKQSIWRGQMWMLSVIVILKIGANGISASIQKIFSVYMPNDWAKRKRKR